VKGAANGAATLRLVPGNANTTINVPHPCIKCV